MILKDEVQIPRDRDTVFQALNDPEILKQSIPGCEELTSTGENELEATVVVKFGPVKASFNSNVVLDPTGGPENFKLYGRRYVGIAGFAKGGADVLLFENADGTLLTFEV